MTERDSGLGRLLVCGFLLMFSALGIADLLRANGTDSRLRITVRVYDYARVSTRELGRAEEEASRIFREVGVEMAWLDCPTSVAEAHNYPACEPRLAV